MSRFNWFAFRQDLSALVGRPVSEAEARQVRRDIAAHNTIQEQWCSEEMTDERRARVEARERGVERRLAEFFGIMLAEFSGDPRGYTVKLIDPRGVLTRPELRRPDVPEDYRFMYFSRDWGGNLCFHGGK